MHVGRAQLTMDSKQATGSSSRKKKKRSHQQRSGSSDSATAEVTPRHSIHGDVRSDEAQGGVQHGQSRERSSAPHGVHRARQQSSKNAVSSSSQSGHGGHKQDQVTVTLSSGKRTGRQAGSSEPRRIPQANHQERDGGTRSAHSSSSHSPRSILVHGRPSGGGESSGSTLTKQSVPRAGDHSRVAGAASTASPPKPVVGHGGQRPNPRPTATRQRGSPAQPSHSDFRNRDHHHQSGRASAHDGSPRFSQYVDARRRSDYPPQHYYQAQHHRPYQQHQQHQQLGQHGRYRHGAHPSRDMPGNARAVPGGNVRV